MSEWITDRLPTKEDGMSHGCVWISYAGKFQITCWNLVHKNEAWMPIPYPEPYVSPRSRPKYFVMKDMFYKGLWAVYDGGKYVTGRMPTQEAAERFAALYNEVMP